MGIWQRISGGWRTQSPGVVFGTGDDGSLNDRDRAESCAIGEEAAMRLSAVWACMHLRAETLGSLPLHLRDKQKNVLTDHDLYDVLHNRPNSMQTAPEFWSQQTANVDMLGNAISVIHRRTRDDSVIALEPHDPLATTMQQRKSGAWYYTIDGEDYDAKNVLHLRGFNMRGYWGMSRLEVGGAILSAQASANTMAMRMYRQGIKVGGFFQPEFNLDTPQLTEFNKRLNEFARPENAGRWLTLLKGMKPIGGAEFRPKAQDVELLQSRYFGIEETCRLFNVPPQLIGHSDKSSSWASSLEHINLFFLMYSLQPTFVRYEHRIIASLLSSKDRVAGIQPKFAIQGLLRSDLKSRTAYYQSALQNGYYNRDEVRDLEERGSIPGGDKYTVQLNLTDIDKLDTVTQDKEPTP